MVKISAKFNRVKFTANLVFICFLLSFADVNAIPQSNANMQNDGGFSLPSSYGKITDINITNSPKIIIQIQDLHCHHQVQKNIASILEFIDKTSDGGINAVWLEGAFGGIDTKWLKPVSSYLDKMLETGYLTGAEYYSALSGKNNLIKGLENEKEYKENLKRLGVILDNQNEINSILRGIDVSTKDLKQKYYNPKQIKIERLYGRYDKNKIGARKYYASLLKYAKQLSIDASKYENIILQANLARRANKLNYKAASKELQKLLSELKNSLTYASYKKIAENGGDYEKLYDSLTAAAKERNIDLPANYPHLNKTIDFFNDNKKINPLGLLDEEESLRNEINSKFAVSKAQKEVMFLIGFGKYLRDFLTSKITSKDYAYYSANVGEYKKLWVKYVDNRVLEMLDGHMRYLEKFYSVNIDRNAYFADALELQESNKINAENGKRQIDIVVAGGFHTDGISRILKERGISYIVITPNVSGETKKAQETYVKIALAQSAALAAAGNPDGYKLSIENSALAAMALSLSPQMQEIVINAVKNGQDLSSINFGVLPSESAGKIKQMDVLIKAAVFLESDARGDLAEVLTKTINDYLPDDEKVALQTFLEKPELIDALAKAVENNGDVETVLKASGAKNVFEREYIILAEKIKRLIDGQTGKNVMDDAVRLCGDWNNLGEKERRRLSKNLLRRYNKIRAAGRKGFFVKDWQIPDAAQTENQNAVNLGIRRAKEAIDGSNITGALGSGLNVLISKANTRLKEQIDSYLDEINEWQKVNGVYIETVPKDSLHMSLFSVGTTAESFKNLNDDLKMRIIQQSGFSSEDILKLLEGADGLGNRKVREIFSKTVEAAVSSELDKMRDEGFFLENPAPEFVIDGIAGFSEESAQKFSLILNASPKTGRDLAVVAKIQRRVKERTGIDYYPNGFNGHIAIGFFVKPSSEELQKFLIKLHNAVKKELSKKESVLPLSPLNVSHEFPPRVNSRHFFYGESGKKTSKNLSSKGIKIAISADKPLGRKWLALIGSDGEKVGTLYKKDKTLTVFSKDAKLSASEVAEILQEMIDEGREELKGFKTRVVDGEIFLVKTSAHTPMANDGVGDSLNASKMFNPRSAAKILSAA